MKDKKWVMAAALMAAKIVVKELSKMKLTVQLAAPEAAPPELVLISKPARIRHYNGVTSPTVNTPTSVAFKGVILQWMLIDNRSTLHDIQVSFDGGVNYKTIDENGYLWVESDELPERLPEDKLYVKSPSTSVSYEILYGEK